jgi:hypothetical protein
MCLGRKIRRRLSYGLGRSKIFSSSAPFLRSLNAEIKTGILAADVGGGLETKLLLSFHGIRKEGLKSMFLT